MLQSYFARDLPSCCYIIPNFDLLPTEVVIDGLQIRARHVSPSVFGTVQIR